MIILDELSQQELSDHWRRVEALQAEGYYLKKENQASSGPVYSLEIRTPGMAVPHTANLVWRESRRDSR